MFSHFVSAARGLFGSPNPNPHAEVEHHNSNQEQDTDASSPLKKEDRSKMVNTRRTTFDAVDAESPAVAQSNNKSTRAGKNKKTQDKDRTPKTPKMGDKKKSRQQEINDDENDDNVEEEQSTPSVPVKEKKETETAKSSHVRFGSEDPEEPSEQLLQEEESATVAAKDEEQEQDEESSDDEAPEAVGKDAALETIKEAARKEAEAKKRLEEQKREKRRERDQRLKSQAIKKAIEKEEQEQEQANTSDDDDENSHSASSSTLHGSASNAHFKPSLPALLPDDILNSEPTPFNIPATLALAMDQENQQEYTKMKPTKRKFLDDYEEEQKKLKTKVIKRGGQKYVVAGRDAATAKGTGLAPRANKGSGNVKARWLAQDRKGIAGATGLRRTAPKTGFVRR